MRLGVPRWPGVVGGLEPAFRAGLRNLQEMTDQGWTLYPTATPPAVDCGITLDGTTQYAVSKPGAFSQAFQSGPTDEVSFVVEFNPSFVYNDGVTHFFFDSFNDATRLMCWKTAANNILLYTAGGATGGIQVDSAVYGPLWRVGDRNLLVVVASVAAGGFVAFNGVVVATSTYTFNVGFKRVEPNPVYGIDLGVDTSGGNFFGGKFLDVQVYPRNLTPAEGAALWNRGTLL